MARSPSALQSIRRKVASQQRLAGAPNADSAFARLHEANYELEHGKRPRAFEGVQRIRKPEPPPKRRKTKIGTFSLREAQVKRKPNSTTTANSRAQAQARPQLPAPAPARPRPRASVHRTSPALEPPENWRPAGGEQQQYLTSAPRNAMPTQTLGIARIPTWRLEAFVHALSLLITRYEDMGEVVTNDLIYGGESLTDLYVEFDSVQVAQGIMEMVDGEVINGRALQLHYA